MLIHKTARPSSNTWWVWPGPEGTECRGRWVETLLSSRMPPVALLKRIKESWHHRLCRLPAQIPWPSYLVVMVSNISVMRLSLSLRSWSSPSGQCFAPVGVADLFGDGNHVVGIRYLKRSFALALQLHWLSSSRPCCSIQWGRSGRCSYAAIWPEGSNWKPFSKKETIAFWMRSPVLVFGSWLVPSWTGFGHKDRSLFKSMSIANDIAGI